MSFFTARKRTRTVVIAATAGLGTTLMLGISPALSAVAAVASGAQSTYLVVYSSGASTAGAAKAISAAGGTLVASYSQIGVVVARSASSDFAATMRSAKGVEGTSSTTAFATRLAPSSPAGDAVAPTVVTGSDSLSALQWDMDQINAPAARAINAGSKSVLVADLDTGIDFTHPDLAAAYDAANSADCTSGRPAPLPAGNDRNGHGTHTAGTIAAQANGTGIIGVAPGVRIAAVKTGNDDGYFFPQAVVCAFMWAGTHGVDVTNNSYFADPWLFNCKNDPEQRAIWTAERRAIRYAQSKGTVVVAAEGNQADDLSHPTQDVTSPDDTTPVTRAVTNACAVVPVEVPGVIGVSATGNLRMKSFYSSYGISTVDVAAPGGDSVLQRTPASPNGRVLSTWSADAAGNCGRQLYEGSALYCWAQGTSMASPHVAGVAALLASATGKRGSALAAALQRAVNPQPCPTDTSMYAFFPAVDNGTPQTCQGGLGHNSWFGAGEVDALKAVTQH